MELSDHACRVKIAVELATEPEDLIGLAIGLGFLESDHPPLGRGVFGALRAFQPPSHMDGIDGGEVLDLRLRFHHLRPDVEPAEQLVAIFARQERKLRSMVMFTCIQS